MRGERVQSDSGGGKFSFGSGWEAEAVMLEIPETKQHVGREEINLGDNILRSESPR